MSRGPNPTCHTFTPLPCYYYAQPNTLCCDREDDEQRRWVGGWEVGLMNVNLKEWGEEEANVQIIDNSQDLSCCVKM